MAGPALNPPVPFTTETVLWLIAVGLALLAVLIFAAILARHPAPRHAHHRFGRREARGVA